MVNSSRVSLGSSVIGSVVLGGGRVVDVVTDVVVDAAAPVSELPDVGAVVVVEATAEVGDDPVGSPTAVVEVDVAAGPISDVLEVVVEASGSLGPSAVPPQLTKQ